MERVENKNCRQRLEYTKRINEDKNNGKYVKIFWTTSFLFDLACIEIKLKITKVLKNTKITKVIHK